MGANAARHAMEIVENVRYVVAIELMTAAQAIDLRPEGPARLGPRTKEAYKEIRKLVSFMDHDRQTTHDIDALVALIRSGDLLEAVDPIV